MKTHHIEECGRVFNRYDLDCPRCRELAAGAPARRSIAWERYAARKLAEERLSAAIRAHDCKKSNCDPVCTAFDW